MNFCIYADGCLLLFLRFLAINSNIYWYVYYQNHKIIIFRLMSKSKTCRRTCVIIINMIWQYMYIYVWYAHTFYTSNWCVCFIYFFFVFFPILCIFFTNFSVFDQYLLRFCVVSKSFLWLEKVFLCLSLIFAL